MNNNVYFSKLLGQVYNTDIFHPLGSYVNLNIQINSLKQP